MDHATVRTVLAQRIRELLQDPSSLPVELRLYQKETLQATERWLEDASGSRRGHIVYATGLGKTVVFASLVAAAGLRSLIIVPTKTLLEQTARVLFRFTGNVIGQVSSMNRVEDASGEVIAVRDYRYCDTVITTDESFARYGHQLARDFAPQLIIYDECHWAYSHPALRTLASHPEAVVIGFTATPDFLTTVAKSTSAAVTLDNGQVLYGTPDKFAATHFGPRLDERNVLWGIEEGYLCPMAWGRIDFSNISLDQVPIVNGPSGPDYQEGALKAVLASRWSGACRQILSVYADKNYQLAKRQVFAVCASVDAAEELARAVQSLGVPAACVTGSTKNQERNRLLDAYRTNRIKFLSSVMVLREGWDAPNAEVCLMLRPTKSRVLYMQSIGRVLRPAEEDCFKVSLVLDAHFQCSEFAPLSAPMVFGEPGKRVRVGGILLGAGAQPTARYVGDGMESPYLLGSGEETLVNVEQVSSERIPTADADSVLRHEGEEWWTRPFIMNFTKLTYGVLESRMPIGRIRSVRGHTNRNGEALFFNAIEVKELFKDRLGPIPQSNEKEILIQDETEFWSMAIFFRKHLRSLYRYRNETSARHAMGAHSEWVRKIHGVTPRNIPCTFYALDDLKRAFSVK